MSLVIVSALLDSGTPQASLNVTIPKKWQLAVITGNESLEYKLKRSLINLLTVRPSFTVTILVFMILPRGTLDRIDVISYCCKYDCAPLFRNHPIRSIQMPPVNDPEIIVRKPNAINP
jgi:hypothetical protein